MEKFPKIETKENLEKPPRYKTISRVVFEILPTGESIEDVIECNGILHRQCRDKVTYDSNQEIEYVDQLSKIELGECDHNH